MIVSRLLCAAVALTIAFALPRPSLVSAAFAQVQQPVRPAADIAPLPPPSTRLERIAFGSCLQQILPQPIWEAILAQRPQLMLMMGDNVYGDFDSAAATQLRAAYDAQARHPEFAKARAMLPMLAVWDDHDYGRNDGGGAFPHKVISAELFHAFWRQQPPRPPSEGIHYSRTFGPVGQRVQIIMLDTRTHRSDLRRKSATFPHWGNYEPDDDRTKTMLGPEQWTWLEARLAEPAEVRLLVSSVQVLAEGHGWERWGNFPHERERLLALLGRPAVRNTVVLSGDRHAGGLYRQQRGGREIVEMTSSSLNSPPRGPMRDTALPPLASELFWAENSGLVQIDWMARSVAVSLLGREGQHLAGHTLRLDP